MGRWIVAVRTVLVTAAFFFSVALIISGHRSISWGGLGIMLVGLGGLLLLLGAYNRNFK